MKVKEENGGFLKPLFFCKKDVLIKKEGNLLKKPIGLMLF